MNYIRLEEVCELITRGYTYSQSSLASTEIETGYPVEIISFSDVDDEGTFRTNNNKENKLTLKSKNIFYKCKAEENDLILPSTAKTIAKAKLLRTIKGKTNTTPVYKSNTILIRVEKGQYDPEILLIIFNNKNIQQRLIEEVYSEGRVKGISLEKLRQFKIPAFTERLRQDIKNYIEYKNKMLEIEQSII